MIYVDKPKVLTPNKHFTPNLKDIEATLRTYDDEIHPLQPQYEEVRLRNVDVLACSTPAEVWDLFRLAYDKVCVVIEEKHGVCPRLLIRDGMVIRPATDSDDVTFHVGYLAGPGFVPEPVVTLV